MKPGSRADDFRYLAELERKIEESFYNVNSENGELKFNSAIEEFCEATSNVQNFNSYVSRNPELVQHLKKMSDDELEMAKMGIGYSITKSGDKISVRLYNKKTLATLFTDQFKMGFMDVMIQDGVKEGSTGFWLTFAGHLSTLEATFALIAYRKHKTASKVLRMH